MAPGWHVTTDVITNIWILFKFDDNVNLYVCKFNVI